MESNVRYVYDKHGIANAYVEENGEKYRVRIETLIIRNGKVLLNKTNKLNQYNRYYKIPGGSIEPGLSLEDSAIKECQEEVMMNVDNMKYCGKIKYIYNSVPEWHKTILWPLGLKYKGCIVYVFIGEYRDKYEGYIKEQDLEPDMLNSRFYSIDDIVLCKEHRKMLKDYFRRRN